MSQFRTKDNNLGTKFVFDLSDLVLNSYIAMAITSHEDLEVLWLGGHKAGFWKIMNKLLFCLLTVQWQYFQPRFRFPCQKERKDGHEGSAPICVIIWVSETIFLPTGVLNYPESDKFIWVHHPALLVDQFFIQWKISVIVVIGSNIDEALWEFCTLVVCLFASIVQNTNAEAIIHRPSWV